jgi:hypothetical protein
MSSTTHAVWPTPRKSERARKASNEETAPRCHRVMCQVGHQKAPQDPHGVLSCCPINVYPMDTHQLTSPQGEAGVRSPAEIWRCRHCGGESALQLELRNRIAPHYQWSRHTHMHKVLLGRKVRKLPLRPLQQSCHHQSGKVTLIRQHRHLHCDRIHGLVIRVGHRLAHNTKSILLMRHCRGIAVMTASWGHRIKTTLKCLLDHGAKGNPCLVWGCQTVPFLKRSDVQAGGEEEADGVGDELTIRTWIAANERCFSAFLNSTEEDFRCVHG